MTTQHQQQIKNAENVNILLPIILLLLFLFGFIKNSKSQPIYVNQAATGLNDGSSWVNAYPSLQTAIEIATPGRQIWVAQGTYKPSAYPIGTTDGSSTRDYSFTLRNNVQIFGGFVATSGTEGNFGLRNFAANPTILSGDIGVVGDLSDNCYHVVLGDYINGTAILDGFTIRDGNANASLITTHTPSGHILPSHSGAGMFLNFASPNINNCIITNNEATFAGGGVVAQGRSDEVFTNCVFANNRILTATFGGAGLYNYAHPSNPSFPTVTNCVFYNNISLGAGGAIYTQYSNMTITNTTIYNNTAQLWGGGIYNEDSSSMVIKNCIIWGNVGNTVSQPSGSDAGLTWNAVEPTVSFSLLQSPSTYSSNISANPLFINSSNPVGADGRWITADDGLRLSTCSPAIDAGTNSGLVMALDIAALIRPQGVGVDMGAYETLPTALAGTTRLYVDAGIAISGVGNSWATAMNNLETALSTARTNTCIREIWVKQGTYKPSHQYSVQTGNDTTANARYQTFNIPSGVAVYGGFIGTETDVTSRPSPLLSSVLSGDIGAVDDNLDNCYHVIVFKNASSTTRLDGFTVTGGFANELYTNDAAGGVYNNGSGIGNISNPTITNCIFQQNFAYNGSAVYNNANYGVCSPTISNCSFLNNGMYRVSVAGGVMYNKADNGGTCNPIITNCIFNRNEAFDCSGIYNLSNARAITNPTISNCSFTNNYHLSSGTIANVCGNAICNPIITQCVFSNNTSGGAASCIYNFKNDSLGNLSPSINHCTFNNNNAISGTIYNEGSFSGICTPIIDSCNFQENRARVGGAIDNIATDAGACYPQISHCNFINNKVLISSGIGGAISNFSKFNSICNSNISDCNFIRNKAIYGGAIGAYSHNASICNSIVTNCTFTNDSATINGGALYNEATQNGTCNLQIDDCKFLSNNAAVYGGAMYAAGTLTGSCNAVITKSKFLNNNALYGGAVFMIRDDSYIAESRFSQCIFDNNSAEYGAGFMAIANATSTINAAFSNCVFTRNNCIQSGGAVYFEARNNSSINPNYEYCTFYNNHNSFGLSGIINTRIATSNNNPVYINCIIRQTAITNVVAGSSTAATPTFTNCNIEGSGGSGAWVASFGANGGENIDTDPLFLNATDFDGVDNTWATSDDGLSLQTASPCINTGNNSLAAATVDIIGNTRPIGGIADMGAYETSVIITHSFSSSAGIGGTISPSGVISVAAGSNFTYTITPNAEFCISNVVVDGMSVGIVSTYTFTSVTAPHTIAVSFVARVTPTVTIVSSQNSICLGSPLTITATAINGGLAPLYNFYVDGVARGATAANSFNSSTLAAGSHIIYCVMTANNICQTTATATSNIKTITVGNATILPAITGTTTLCSIVATTRLHNTVAGGVWSSSNAAVATINSSGVVTAVANGVTSITYTYTNSFGCASSTSVNVVVAAVTVTPIIGASSVCIGSSITLLNATSGGAWSSVTGRAIVSSSGIVTGISVGTATIRYTFANEFGCIATSTFLVSVNSTPAIPTIQYAPGTVNPQRGAPTGAFCANRTFTVVGIPSGGLWSSTGSIAVGSSTGIAITSSTIGAGSLTYTFTSPFGCSNSRTMVGSVFICASSRGVNMVDREPLTVDRFTIYPNPAKNSVSIQVDKLITDGQIIVTDLYGKTIKSQPLSIGKNNMDVSSFSKGLYFVNIITNQNRQTQKLVIE
jgi:hypothetical protein